LGDHVRRVLGQQQDQHEQSLLAEALRHSAEVLNSTLRFDEVLERILDSASRVVPHEAAGLWMMTNTGEVYLARFRGRISPELAARLRAQRISLESPSLFNRLYDTRQPVILTDAEIHSSWGAVAPETHWVRSSLGVALSTRGQVMGFLHLASGTPNFYNEAYARQLQAFADQAAIAIENARLYDSLQQQAAELTALYRASAQLLNPGDGLATLADQIAHAVTQEFEFADCGVMIVDELAGELRRVARAGPYAVRTTNPLLLDGLGLTVAAVRTGQVVYAPDVTRDPRYIPNESRTRSELVVPLRAGGRVTGVLDLQSSEPNAFDDRAIRIITTFAERAALALSNALMIERLNQARQIAEEASRIKSEFLANTSHELRTPLTAIMGSLNLFLNDESDSPEEARQFVQIGYDSARNLLAIVNDLLDIARIEAGRMVVKLHPTDVTPMLADVYMLMWAQAENRKLKLDIRLPETPVIVMADPEKLKQVLLNLVGNALKFTEHGSVTVRVELDQASGACRIHVQDTGIGIPMDKQAQLFQPFVQVDGTSTRRYGGTGLGLSISRRLAEMMGGALSLYSAGEQQGSTLTLTLPLAQPEHRHYPEIAD
jgi:signal transduction histidine kinase